MVKHFDFFHLFLLCVVSLVISSSVIMPAQAALSGVVCQDEKCHYLPASFENPLYTVDSANTLSESSHVNYPTLKNQFSSYSVHSIAAHSLIETKTSEYISSFEFALIQPQIFDLLFPFHYYL